MVDRGCDLKGYIKRVASRSLGGESVCVCVRGGVWGGVRGELKGVLGGCYHKVALQGLFLR